MSAFSPEYLAEIDRGSVILSECHQCLDLLDGLFEKMPTPEAIQGCLIALGRAAAAVQLCNETGSIMPHDADEVTERFLQVSIRAEHWVTHLTPS